MSDTSNRFSLEGFNRQKQFSGLHARQPENIGKYYDYNEIYVNPQYVSILSATVEHVGFNYPKESSIVFPVPEHPEGLRASGIPIFQLYADSVTMTNSGSGYDIYDSFEIYNSSNNPVGSISVITTGSNGSIGSFDVFGGLKWASDLEGLYYFSNSDNASAQFSINNNFAIVGITITFQGIGYQTFAPNLTEINHDPRAYPFATTEFDDQTLSSDYSSDPPIGLVARSSKDPYIVYTPRKETIRDSHIKNSNPSRDPDVNYTVITSFSLGSPDSDTTSASSALSLTYTP